MLPATLRSSTGRSGPLNCACDTRRPLGQREREREVENEEEVLSLMVTIDARISFVRVVKFAQFGIAAGTELAMELN